RAKVVFHGSLFDVYHWRQRMFDGSTQTYEALSRPPSVQVLATQRSRILLAHERQPAKRPFIGFFGGVTDKGETALQAAKRELAEETGLSSKEWVRVGKFQSGGRIAHFTTFFIARDCVKVQEPHLDPGEDITIETYTFDQFLVALLDERFRAKDIAFFLTKMRFAGGGRAGLKEFIFGADRMR
ncbi:MAG: NUDIX hydrolase, partial [Nanoarchaeota archaeon]